jgi:hypothetical protein
VADDHSFHGAETAVLRARGANEVDGIGMPDNVHFDVWATPFRHLCFDLSRPQKSSNQNLLF